jgi:hypothetical protein
VRTRHCDEVYRTEGHHAETLRTARSSALSRRARRLEARRPSRAVHGDVREPGGRRTALMSA